MKFKKKIKRILKSFGYDLTRINGGLGYGTTENELLKIIESVDTDLVLDIGANKGQFASKLYNYGYNKELISFEPLSEPYKKLLKKSENNSKWKVYEKCCVGADTENIDVQISNLIGNSSILNIKSTKFNVKGSHFIGKENVKQITLASLNNSPLLSKAKNVFIKMDIQGYEHFVLSKLEEVEYFINGFFIELSLIKLYEEEKDFLSICNQLKGFGYNLVYITPEFINANRMVQINGVFLHNTLV